MFKDDTFSEWLNIQAAKSMEQINNNDISKEDRNFHMLVIMLKAQTNHFEHLDEDLRNDMKSVKKDILDLREDMKILREDMKILREDMNKGFIDMYRHMNRSFLAMFGITITIASIATAIIKFL